MADAIQYSPSNAGVCVSDLERAVRFYCDGLGFELSDRFDADTAVAVGLDEALEVKGPVNLQSQMIVSGGMKLELLAYPGRPTEGTPSTSRGLLGLTHLSFWVDDVEAAAARLVECGGTILDSTRQNVGIPLLFLTDPDGTRIELMGGTPPA